MAFQAYECAQCAGARKARDRTMTRKHETCDGIQGVRVRQCAGARKARDRTMTREHKTCDGVQGVRVRTMRRSSQGARSYNDAKAQNVRWRSKRTSAHNAQERARRETYNDAKAQNVRWRSKRTLKGTKTCEGGHGRRAQAKERATWPGQRRTHWMRANVGQRGIEDT